MQAHSPVHLTECPRDAMQGLHTFIPTDLKVQYINALLEVGFHTLDFGSFVSPKAIPQMADTREVAERINWENSSTQLLAIVLNEQGTKDALALPQVKILGFPWSLSPTFQLRNGNQTPEQAWAVLNRIAALAHNAGRELLVYLSMGFGNPYGDTWAPGEVLDAVRRIAPLGVRTFALADTIGAAQPGDIRSLFSQLISSLPELSFGAHFHATPTGWLPKVHAAWEAGCRRFDSAIGGFGGCPFAQDELVGNIPTESLISYFEKMKDGPSFDQDSLSYAKGIAEKIFGDMQKKD